MFAYFCTTLFLYTIVHAYTWRLMAFRLMAFYYSIDCLAFKSKDFYDCMFDEFRKKHLNYFSSVYSFPVLQERCLKLLIRI